MNSPPLALTRRLGTLEVLDAAAWVVRDDPAAWLFPAGLAGGGFAVALSLFQMTCSQVPEDRQVIEHFALVAGSSLALALVFLARGFGRWAAVDAFHRRIRGEARSFPASAAATLRRLPTAITVSAWPAALLIALAPVGIYPGLALSNRWAVSLPAAVFEDLPVAVAGVRSSRLMERSASGMALLLLNGVVGLVAWGNLILLGYLLPTFVGTFLGIDAPYLSRWLHPSNMTWILLSAGFAFAAADTLGAATSAVLYLNLRVEREGGDLQSRVDALPVPRRDPVEAARA